MITHLRCQYFTVASNFGQHYHTFAYALASNQLGKPIRITSDPERREDQFVKVQKEHIKRINIGTTETDSLLTLLQNCTSLQRLQTIKPSRLPTR